jgi:hypothetical protein
MIMGPLIKHDGFLRWWGAGRKRRKPKGLMSGPLCCVCEIHLRLGAQDYIAGAASFET